MRFALARHGAGLRLAACAGALLLGVPAASAQALEPWQMMRSLQLLQDRIADGDAAALPMQRRLLEMTDKRLRGLTRDELANRRNFDAVMVYAMGGGNPATVHALMPDLLLAAEKLDAPPPLPDEEDAEEASEHEAVEAPAKGHDEAAAEASGHENPADGHGGTAGGGHEAAEQEAPQDHGEPREGEGRPAAASADGRGESSSRHAAPGAVEAAAGGHHDAQDAASAQGSAHGEGRPPADAPNAGTAGKGHGSEPPAGHGETPAHDTLTTGSTAPADGHGGSSGDHGGKAAKGHGGASGAVAPAPSSGQKRRLALGVYNYGRGRLPDAKTALGPVDPLLERAEVGSYLALIRGALLANEDPRGALRFLDTARLLGTGTLVEEAALRRSVTLAAAIGDNTRFLRASGQYVRRFLRSPYASQFADGFVAGVVALGPKLDLEAVGTVTAGMTREQERVVYLRIARRAAIDNAAVLSAFASAKADRDATGGAPPDPRAALYAALPDVAEPGTAQTLRRLEAIDPAGLTAGDRALLEAAKVVASETLAVPPAPEAPAPVPAPPAKAEPIAGRAEAADAALPGNVEADMAAAGEEPLESVEDVAPAQAPQQASPAPTAAAQPQFEPAADRGQDASAGTALPVASPADASPADASPPDAADAKMTEARRALDAVDRLLKDASQ